MRIFAGVLLATVLIHCAKRDSSNTAAAGALSPETAFWRWFIEHEEAIRAIKTADEPIADELAEKLQAIHPDLVFEVGVGLREIIISADGVHSAFPAVLRVVEAAPEIPGWKIIAFRPRKPGFNIKMDNGVELALDAMTFRVLGSEDRKVDVAIYVKGIASPGAEIRQVVYLQLDSVLGEYDTETYLGGIDVRAGSEAPADARPLKELAVVVDALK